VSLRKLALFIIFVVVVVAALIFGLMLVRQPHIVSDATIRVDSGDAALVHADGKQETLATGNSVPFKVGESLQAHGNVTLLFMGATVEAPAATELALVDYTTNGNEAQVNVALKAGQVVGNAAGYAGSGSGLTVTTPAGALTTRSGELLAAINPDALSEFGMIAGTGQLSAHGKTYALLTNQGTSVAVDSEPAAPTLWAPVSVMTYRPNGAMVSLPTALSNAKTHDTFNFTTNEPFVVPPGIYNLTVNVLSMYKASNIALKSGVANDLPITLAETVFTVVDEAGRTVNTAGLTLHGDEVVHVTPGTPILVSPGQSTITAAQDEAPDATQPVNLDLEPGQRAPIPLHASFFGGGRVKVSVVPPNGVTVPPYTASIYPANGEGNPPLQTFKTDSPSPFLAPGDYIVVVPTEIAVRFQVTIAKNQDVSLTVPLGTLVVNYTDTLGRPTAPFMYIAAAGEMERMGLTILKMAQTPYGLSTHAGTLLLLPAGHYTIRIDDKKDVDIADVKLDPSIATTLPVQGIP